MLFLNENNIIRIGMNWRQLIDTMESAVYLLKEKDYEQPLKPYLRYKNNKNRIIAMPSYVGGDFDVAGLKWIASFPENIKKDLPRAHSITILNDADTGKPIALINTSLISVIRTVTVSGLMLKHMMKMKKWSRFTLGIVGWGPIGQYHLKMIMELYGDRVEKILLYDINAIDLSTTPSFYKQKIQVAKHWEEVYQTSDLFITSTVSEDRYIDQNPKAGSVLFHISLRDYTVEALKTVKTIIVDDWLEVCRENTDIQMLHFQNGLEKENTLSMVNVVCEDALDQIDANETILFSPMGMAAFDIVMAAYYVQQANARGIGLSFI